MQASNFFVSPKQTPTSVRWVLWITIVTSLLAPISTFFLEHYFALPGPAAWLSLSLAGLKELWLWQPLTYFFLQSAGVGITFSFLISLFFLMLVLWFTGSEISSRFGKMGFILLYLGAGITAGLVATGTLFLSSSQSVLVGSGPAVYALVTVWAMLYPDLELFFFFLIRIKAKVLVALYLGLTLLIHLSYGEFIPFIADLSGIVWGFLIGRFVWKLKNPFPLNLEIPSRKKNKHRDDKIIDISVFQEEDDAFMDRMLDKINEQGEKSLTARERERMRKISTKK